MLTNPLATTVNTDILLANPNKFMEIQLNDPQVATLKRYFGSTQSTSSQIVTMLNIAAVLETVTK